MTQNISLFCQQHSLALFVTVVVLSVALLISLAVIVRQWLKHRRLMEKIEGFISLVLDNFNSKRSFSSMTSVQRSAILSQEVDFQKKLRKPLREQLRRELHYLHDHDPNFEHTQQALSNALELRLFDFYEDPLVKHIVLFMALKLDVFTSKENGDGILALIMSTELLFGKSNATSLNNNQLLFPSFSDDLSFTLEKWELQCKEKIDAIAQKEFELQQAKEMQ